MEGAAPVAPVPQHLLHPVLPRLECDGPITQVMLWSWMHGGPGVWRLSEDQPIIVAQQEPSHGLLLGKKKELALGEQIPLAT